MPSGRLHIIKASYYDPKLGPDIGTDVTTELSSELANNQLIYSGAYNSIFPDHFSHIRKKLRIELEYERKRYTKIYDENERIRLPLDLGLVDQEWWKKPWVQILSLLGALASIAGILEWLL
ncbi:hypothetical protein HY346_02035 [Candidatus Microgenomates bacterium]|nr:hypothetical protein [Candidatus Microgenomates bacterium]